MEWTSHLVHLYISSLTAPSFSKVSVFCACSPKSWPNAGIASVWLSPHSHVRTLEPASVQVAGVSVHAPQLWVCFDVEVSAGLEVVLLLSPPLPPQAVTPNANKTPNTVKTFVFFINLKSFFATLYSCVFLSLRVLPLSALLGP